MDVRRLIGIAKGCAEEIEAEAGSRVSALASGKIKIKKGWGSGVRFAAWGGDGSAEGELPWGEVHSTFRVSDKRLLVEASDPAESADASIRGRVVDAASTVVQLVNRRLYNGSGADQMVGLLSAIGDDTNTYAGIDRTVGANAYWRPYVIDPGAPTVLTLEQIKLDISRIGERCGTCPDIALVSSNTYHRVREVSDGPKVMFEHASHAGGVTIISTDVPVVIDGCLFIDDVYAPDGHIFYLNTAHVWLEYLPTSLLPDTYFWTHRSVLGMGLCSIDSHGLYSAYAFACYPQLVVDRPNACGVRYNVAV